MYHKVKSVSPLPDFKLIVQFSEGVTKLYDLKPLFERIPPFRYLRENSAEFDCVSVDVGGYGVIWGDELDLSCDELWENGILHPPVREMTDDEKIDVVAARILEKYKFAFIELAK